MKTSSKIFSLVAIVMLLHPHVRPGGVLSRTEQSLEEQKLIFAIRTEDEGKLDDLLSQEFINVNTKVGNNKSLLHVLIENHVKSHDCSDDCFHIKAFRRLIESGANVDAKATNASWFHEWLNITPLHLAAKYCLSNFIQILFDNGATVHAKAFKATEMADRCTPLDLAQNYAEPHGSQDETIILLQTCEQELRSIQSFLRKKKKS